MRHTTTKALAAALLVGVVGFPGPAQAGAEDIPTDPCEVIYCPPPIDPPPPDKPCADLDRQLDIWQRWAGYLRSQIAQERAVSDLLRGDLEFERFKRAEQQADLVMWQQFAFERSARVRLLEGKVAHKQATIDRLRARLRALR